MYTIHELVSLTGVKRSTIRKWTQLGMLSRPSGGRRYAQYDDRHVRTINRIKEELVDGRITRREFAERLDYERLPDYR